MFCNPVDHTSHDAVCCAQGVKAADPSGKSDPYCVLSLVGSSEPVFKTDVCPATLNPSWNQSFSFPPSSLSPFKQTIGQFYSLSQAAPVTYMLTSHIHTLTPSHPHMLTGENGEVQYYGYLLIEIWDHDKVNQDDYLGRLVIPLCDIVSSHSGEVWYPITRKGVKDTVSGRIKVKLSLRLEEEMVSVQISFLILFLSLLYPSPLLSPLSPSHPHSSHYHPLTITLPTVTLPLPQTLDYSSLNDQLYTACKARGYQLPVESSQIVLELPGRAERVEMMLAHVLVDVSSFYCSAQVFLTNYR